MLMEMNYFILTSEVLATAFEHTTAQFANEHSTSLANWFSAHLGTKWLWIRILLLSLKVQVSRLSSFRFRQL